MQPIQVSTRDTNRMKYDKIYPSSSLQDNRWFLAPGSVSCSRATHRGPTRQEVAAAAQETPLTSGIRLNQTTLSLKITDSPSPPDGGCTVLQEETRHKQTITQCR